MPKGIARFAGFAVALIWGMTFLSIKVAVGELGPMTLAASRFVIACLVIPLIARASGTRLAIRAQDAPLMALGGLVGVTFYFWCENNGVMLLSASEASIIVGTIPIITLIMEIFVYRSSPGARVWAGVALSFAGVAVMVAGGGSGETGGAVAPGGGSTILGYLFMAGAALSWSAYSFITKPLSARYSHLAITFWQLLFGTIACLPLAALEAPRGFPSLAVSLNVVFLGVFGSAFGYWLYVIMLERLGASRSSVFINLIPVVSVAASFVILGERLSGRQAAGGLVAIAGVFLATWVPRTRLGRTSP